MRALVLSENGFEDSELLYPRYRLLELGWSVDVASSAKGALLGKVGYSAEANRTYADCREPDYDLLLLPGGKSPERVRIQPAAVELVRAFDRVGKPIAAICHAAQILISAGLVAGRTLTCYVGVRDDVIAAGGNYLDQACVVEGNLITSRTPADLPMFMRQLVETAARSASAAGGK